MIAYVYGTTAELIKMAPILIRLRERRVSVITLCTGQHVRQIPTLLDDLGLPQPDVWLARGNDGNDLERFADIPRWGATIAACFARQRRTLRARLRASRSSPLVIVHGDTLSAVAGAVAGRMLRARVAHVEAGMLSFNLRVPFPEELDRLIIARLARTHYAPNARAAANLRRIKVRGEIVDTGTNTIRDAIELVPPTATDVALPSEPFGLVSLHRTELLLKPEVFRTILVRLREESRSRPILFLNHPVTAAAIAKLGLDVLFDEHFRRVPRQRFFSFIALLKASAFLVTDSGGSQQECAQLGHPCLLHRTQTEHADGLDGPVVLSHLDPGIVDAFLRSPRTFARSPRADSHAPSDVIVDHLASHGYLNPA